jgi:hypothetical protein
MGVKSIDTIDKRILDAYMERYKDASIFTVKREVSSLNKIFSSNYSSADFGFHQKRSLDSVWHNRGELPKTSTSHLERNQLALDFIRATEHADVALKGATFVPRTLYGVGMEKNV